MGIETPKIFPDKPDIEPELRPEIEFEFAEGKSEEDEASPEKLGRFSRVIHKLFGRETESEEEQETKREASPKRFTLSVELMKKLFSEVEVEGKENIDEIPDGKKIILASTHTSEFDMPLVAAALSRDLKLAMTYLSYKDKFTKIARTSALIGDIWIAGRENFLPITYVKAPGKEKGRQGQIEPKDMENITSTLDQGSAVVIAAHNPVFNDTMPDKPGFAAIRVAQLAGEEAVVVPIAVQVGDPSIEGRTKWSSVIKNRPKAKVVIGKSLVFNDPDAKEAAGTIDAILKDREYGDELSSEESQRMKEARRVIDETEGAKLMNALASLLPDEMRGKWGAEDKEHIDA